MRTKNAKRLWPVPATLAVMAMTAFLVFGLTATTGAQPAAAQDGADCTVTIDTAIGDDLLAIDTANTDMSCNAFGGTATIELVGPGGDPEALKEIPLYVLVQDKGGSLSFYPMNSVWQSENQGDGDLARRRGAFYAASTGTTVVGATKYSDQDVSVPRASRKGGRFVPQSTTITVGGEGTVYVYLPQEYDDGIVRNFAEASNFYGSDCEPSCTAADAETPIRPPGSAQKFNDTQPGAASAMITITFLGTPSLTQEDTALLYDDDKDANTDAVDPNESSETDPASALGAFKVVAPGLAATERFTSATDADGPIIEQTDIDEYRGYLWLQKLDEDLVLDAIPNAAAIGTGEAAQNRVFIIAEVRDDEGKQLSGSNVESSVTFNVMFHADSDLKSVARFEYSEPQDVNATGRASIELTGWTTNVDETKVGSVRVTVTANYAGPSGRLDLGKVELSRVGDPANLTTGTYSCAPLGEGEKDAKKDGCPVGVDGTATVDEVPDTNAVADMVFGRGDVIVVKASLTDELGSKSPAEIDYELSTDAKGILNEAPAADGALIRYTVGEEANLGQYADAITVSYGAGDDLVEEKLSFTVSGKAENFMFDMPTTYIGLATGTVRDVHHRRYRREGQRSQRVGDG